MIFERKQRLEIGIFIDRSTNHSVFLKSNHGIQKRNEKVGYPLWDALYNYVESTNQNDGYLEYVGFVFAKRSGARRIFARFRLRAF